MLPYGSIFCLLEFSVLTHELTMDNGRLKMKVFSAEMI